MTDQTIHPCPVCGAQPELIIGPFGTVFGCKKCDIAAPRRDRWELLVRDVLGRACRELGVETVEQLKARLAPDPRVAVLEIALTKVAESDLSQVPYSQIKAHIEEALFRSQFIAAQRGDV